MSVTVTPLDGMKIWEDFISTHSEANFLHSWWWGEFQQAINHQVIRRGIYKDKELVGVLLLIVENAKRGRHCIVPAGPIIDWHDKAVVKAVVQEMKDVAKAYNCVFVRVRPQLISDNFSRSLFRSLGFRPAPMHLHAELTWQLDLTKTDEELLAGMRKKSRYELKQADKQNILVTTTTDVSALNKFYEIQLETAKRHKFVPFSKQFLMEQFKVFSAQDKVLLFEAYRQKTLLAQAFIIFYGKEAAYHYGTGTDAGRKFPGAYAIQWAAIQEAKKRGMKRYNFWGVTKPEQVNHRFYGVSVFKRGFGGEEVEYLHAQDLVINPTKYALNLLIETVRKKTRHLG